MSVHRSKSKKRTVPRKMKAGANSKQFKGRKAWKS